MFCGGLWPEMKNSVIRNPLGIAYLHIVDKLTNCLNSHHHHMNCTRFTENTPPSPPYASHAPSLNLHGSEKGSDELPEARVGEDTAVQVRAVLLGCANGHRGNQRVGR